MTPYCDRDRREDQRPGARDRGERAKSVEAVEVFEFIGLDAHELAFTLGAFVALLRFVGPGFGICAFGNHANKNLIVVKIAPSRFRQVRFERARNPPWESLRSVRCIGATASGRLCRTRASV